MLEFLKPGGFRATFTRPLVYLDHWAVREFSDDAAHRDRLLGTLDAAGHVGLSTPFFYEMSMQEDGRSVSDMQRFLEAVGDRYYLLDPSPVRVAARMQRSGMKEQAASFDREATKILSLGMNARTSSITAADASRVFREHREIVQQLLPGVRSEIQESVESGRQQHRAGGPIRRSKSGPECLQCLDALLYASFAAKEPFEPNDAMDLVHTAVPISICDFVLIDQRWKLRAETISAPPRRARIFSKKKGQIDAFLAALEAWTPPPEVK